MHSTELLPLLQTCSQHVPDSAEQIPSELIIALGSWIRIGIWRV